MRWFTRCCPTRQGHQLVECFISCLSDLKSQLQLRWKQSRILLPVEEEQTLYSLDSNIKEVMTDGKNKLFPASYCIFHIIIDTWIIKLEFFSSVCHVLLIYQCVLWNQHVLVLLTERSDLHIPLRNFCCCMQKYAPNYKSLLLGKQRETTPAQCWIPCGTVECKRQDCW